ncbi:hypothetical protein AVEN_224187-1 [Araneus ventricosus]|uniref:Uncharacterized protein n=1 Tax=Araneus ventricosus TaxID=182803 RepID=A0A4Y2EJ62_ARAVE|nr:hypothetical protein AVEN_224187-1 [Araneus ventricosus]
MLDRPTVLSRPFTSLPKWNFWNTGRKKQSSVLKTDGNWHSGMAMLEFKRTQNPTLHAPIPILGPRLEGSGTSKDLPTLRPHVEDRNETRNLRVGEEEGWWVDFCDFEPCLKTNFGNFSVNDGPTRMDGKKPQSWDKWNGMECRRMPCLGGIAHVCSSSVSGHFQEDNIFGQKDHKI